MQATKAYGVELNSFLSSTKGRSEWPEVLAALPPGKAPLVSVAEEAEWASESVWTLSGLYSGFVICPACVMAVVVTT